MNSTAKHTLIWVFIVAALSCLWIFVAKNRSDAHDKAITATELLNDATEGKVAEITVNSGSNATSSKATGRYKDGNSFSTTIPVFYPDLYKALQDHGVKVSVDDQNSEFWPVALQYLPMLIVVLPFILIFGLIIPSWQIVKKAGFPAPLSLLLLIPFVNLAAIYIFAFSTWKVIPASQHVSQ